MTVGALGAAGTAGTWVVLDGTTLRPAQTVKAPEAGLETFGTAIATAKGDTAERVFALVRVRDTATGGWTLRVVRPGAPGAGVPQPDAADTINPIMAGARIEDPQLFVRRTTGNTFELDAFWREGTVGESTLPRLGWSRVRLETGNPGNPGTPGLTVVDAAQDLAVTAPAVVTDPATNTTLDIDGYDVTRDAPNRLIVAFASDQTRTNRGDIYVTTRQAGGPPWSAAVNLSTDDPTDGEFNGTAESDPSIGTDPAGLRAFVAWRKEGPVPKVVVKTSKPNQSNPYRFLEHSAVGSLDGLSVAAEATTPSWRTTPRCPCCSTGSTTASGSYEPPPRPPMGRPCSPSPSTPTRRIPPATR